MIVLEEYIKNKNNKMETKQTIGKYIKHNYQSAFKKLIRMLDANFIRKGISSEFLEIINGHLEKTTENMQNTFSDDERKQKVKEIWYLLRNHISSKEDIVPVLE